MKYAPSIVKANVQQLSDTASAPPPPAVLFAGVVVGALVREGVPAGVAVVVLWLLVDVENTTKEKNIQ